MKLARGTCPQCKSEHELERGRVPYHERAYGWADGVAFASRPCDGSHRRAVEVTARDREAGRARRRKVVTAARAEAAVALDAWLVGDFQAAADIGLSRLLDLALVAYRLDHPESRVQDRVRCGYRRDLRVDLFCTFCGELVTTAPRQWWASAVAGVAVDDHTVPCALQFLAGLRKSVAPSTRTLPSQLLLGDDA